MRSDKKQRDSVADLKELVVNPTDNFPITLDSISDIVETVGPAQINRINQQRVAHHHDYLALPVIVPGVLRLYLHYSTLSCLVQSVNTYF